jgi:hypothetical protein
MNAAKIRRWATWSIIATSLACAYLAAAAIAAGVHQVLGTLGNGLALK